MGRPRLIRTKDGGEISLKNLSPELVEKVRVAVEDPIVNIAPPTEDTTFDDPVVTDMSQLALGAYKDKDGWHVVQVMYDPVSGKAEVKTNEKVGIDKIYATERYKILSSEYNLV